MKIIAVDIGGTKILFGIVQDGIIKHVIRIPTEHEKGPKYIINKKIIQTIEKLMDDGVMGIAIGCPGPLDYKTGVIINPPNLSRWRNINLKRILERKFKLPVKVDNDTNAFALGEKRASNMVAITLGTGVGSGVIINNKLYHGDTFASELGHMIIQADGREGPDGIQGSFENCCSGTAIEKAFFEKTGKKKTAEEIAEMEDKESKEVLNETAHFLALALNNIKNIFDPELIVLGGSLAKIDYMVKKAVKEMQRMPYKSKVKVELAKNEYPTLLGAYKLFSE